MTSRHAIRAPQLVPDVFEEEKAILAVFIG